MRALIAYVHLQFLRSYRYGPPALLYVTGIFFIYSVVPNPVMNSYAFSMTFLFVIAGFIGYVLIDMQEANQEEIVAVHSGSIVRPYLATVLYGWLFTVPLTLYAVLYPIFLDKFDRSPQLDEVMLALLSHGTASWLGVVMASWFGVKCIRSRVMAFFAFGLALVVTISVQSLAQQLPDGWKGMIWILPPLHMTMRLLMTDEPAVLITQVVAIALPLLYGGVLAGLYIWWLSKRKLARN